MKLPQLILIPVCILLVTIVYLFGKTRFPEGVTKEGPMQSSAHQSQSVSNSNEGFEHVLSMATGRLNKIQHDSLFIFNEKVNQVAENKKEDAYKSLGKFWMRTGNLITGATYFEKAAELHNTKENWRTTAEIFAYAYNGAADSVAKNYALDQAINSYQQLLKIDSSDLNDKVQLATLYVVGKGQIMNGVLMLKDVEKQDPDNEQMNLMLGKLGIISNQFDKAIPRLEKLIGKHPDNVEAYYHLAEAYRATGKKNEAIKMLEECKLHVGDSKEALQQIDNLINDIKKS